MSSATQEFVSEQIKLNERREKLHPWLRRIVAFLANFEVIGEENMPTSGPTLLIGNHVSLADPILFTSAIDSRYLISMAKAETLNNFLQRSMLQIWGNFVINRGEVDRRALNNTIALLKSEQLVWIAPEGTRNPHGMGEAKGGVAYIAHKADAVIVPSAICGPQDWAQRLSRFRKVNAKLIFGKPFRFRIPDGERLSRDVRDAMITEAMYQLATIMPEEYAFQRGAYSNIENATTKYLDFL